MRAKAAAADPLAALTGAEAVAPVLPGVAEACAQAVRLACAATGRKRAILSGSLAPATAAAVEAALRGDEIRLEILPPDPLGLEDLAGRTGWDLAALVIQTPDPFGGVRSFGLAAALCREEGTVPVVLAADLRLLARRGPPDADLVVVDGTAPGLDAGCPLGLLHGHPALARWAAKRVPQPPLEAAAAACRVALDRMGPHGLADRAIAAEAAAERIAARLRRQPGIRVLSGDRFAAVAIHLGEEGDAVAAAERLARLAGIAALPLARLYPSWPELRPVMVISASAPLDDGYLDRLAAALAPV